MKRTLLFSLFLGLVPVAARAEGEFCPVPMQRRPAAPGAARPQGAVKPPDAARTPAGGKTAAKRAPAAAGPAPASAAPSSALHPAERPPAGASGDEEARLPTDPELGEPAACLPSTYPDRSCFVRHPLCDRDRELARIAWQYFRKNTQPTGLVNAVDGYPSTTIWDAGSSLAAIVAAGELDLISPKERDDRVAALLTALAVQPLYRGQLPNKAYSSLTNTMTDYANKPSPAGIGYSALDIARVLSVLDLVSCVVPSQRQAAEQVVARWNFCPMVRDGQLFGAAEDGTAVQEGRFGYEQYAGRALEQLGFEVPVSSRYDNAFAAELQIEGVPIAYDRRDPRDFGAINYVVTESYALDAIENGVTARSAKLLRNLFDAQRKRYERTGLVTAVTEDHVDRAPWFVYNTLYAAGETWKAITETGQDAQALKSISVKAALSLATLFPDEPYSALLADSVKSAYDAERGWYGGIYESGMGYNRALTSNTNGVLLELMLYKLYGPLRAACSACHQGLRLPQRWLDAKDAKARCLPTRSGP